VRLLRRENVAFHARRRLIARPMSGVGDDLAE
jgi:hypothetical protein